MADVPMPTHCSAPLASGAVVEGGSVLITAKFCVRATTSAGADAKPAAAFIAFSSLGSTSYFLNELCPNCAVKGIDLRLPDHLLRPSVPHQPSVFAARIP